MNILRNMEETITILKESKESKESKETKNLKKCKIKFEYITFFI